MNENYSMYCYDYLDEITNIHRLPFGGEIMSCRLFRTKDRRIIAVILLLVTITAGLSIWHHFRETKKYEEQTVMAKEYLKEKNFKEAVKAYQKAISMKGSNEEMLVLGLSEAYIGEGDYNQALEILRNCYQKTSGDKIKKKIEEVTLKITDSEYLKTIKRADKYYANSEYDRAISEYEKAKLIKSKEITSYQRIAEVYIKQNDYSSACDEVMDGIEITHSNELKVLLNKIKINLTDQKYDSIVKEADEYNYQENYEESIEKYKEAIKLKPLSSIAYLGLAKTYLARKEYDQVVSLMQEARKLIKDDEINSMLDKATKLKAAADERKRILTQLYKAFQPLDTKKVIQLMNEDFFHKKIILNTPIYYSDYGEGKLTKGIAMIIYNKSSIYYGNIYDSMRRGRGVYFKLKNKKSGQVYYYYAGEWNNDIPEGIGKTEELAFKSNSQGSKYKLITVTDGSFINGYENGSMKKTFYRSGKETGYILYQADNGKPMPFIDENNQQGDIKEGEPYAIAELYKKEKPTGKYYMAEPNTLWGVKPFINK